MTYKLYPHIDIRDLEIGIKLQFDVDVDISELFWRDYDNNCIFCYYRELDWLDENVDEYTTMELVCAYLRDVIPDYDACYIDR